jgi:hypothetical protein
MKLNQGLGVLENVDERYAWRRLAPSFERRQSAQGAKTLRRLESLDPRCIFALDHSKTNHFWLAVVSPRNQHDVTWFYAS